MMKKKILFHINSLGKGGAEKVVTVLGKYFAKDGYEVVLATLWRAEDEYELDESVRRINFEDLHQGKKMGRIQRALSRFTDLSKVLKAEKPDIVISFCNKANFRSAYSMMGSSTPLLTSVRNDPRIDYLPYKTSMKRMEKRADGCVFQTPDAMSCFSKEFQKKSKVIWNPVDEKYIKVSEIVERSRDIVCVGRFSAQKNQLLLLKAFERIREQFPDTVLKLYGEESEKGAKAALLSFVEEHHMEDAVRFMGQSSHLEQEIHDAALFVLPSDYEGMPNALIEAMVMGIPVISTDCPCGGPAQLIEDGKTGILVKVGDEEELANAMRRLLSDKEYAAILGQNAKMLADKVSPDKVYEEWKAFVNALIEG